MLSKSNNGIRDGECRGIRFLIVKTSQSGKKDSYTVSYLNPYLPRFWEECQRVQAPSLDATEAIAIKTCKKISAGIVRRMVSNPAMKYYLTKVLPYQEQGGLIEANKSRNNTHRNS